MTTRLVHDTGSFTQGLQWVDGLLVETTGLKGRSRLNIIGTDGTLLRTTRLPDDVFAEGVAVADGTVWVLTWHDRRILRYTWPALDPLEDLPLDGEGWGACHDGELLWTSDGSATLTGRDPGSGEPVRAVTVRDSDGRRLTRLNELDCAPDGTIWANVWQSTLLARIDPATGAVTGTVDLSDLSSEVVRAGTGPDGVANGVASGPSGLLWVTGKGWPTLFLIDPTLR